MLQRDVLVKAIDSTSVDRSVSAYDHVALESGSDPLPILRCAS